MKLFKRLFHFLGGIYLALTLITLAALTVVAGTLLESYTGSHLMAARWTYASPLFLLLLCFFFINILFSALRRWPFKRRHIPFLITHLGLLMILSGTILKNRLGLQGQLSVWEGSGNQHVLLPHTYALSIEQKESSSQPMTSSSFSFDSFHPHIYYPFHFPHLKFKLIGYAPHVKETLETWIKDSKAYIAGFPAIPVQTWKPSQSFPHEDSYLFAKNPSSSWTILALRTSHVQQALEQAYVKGLTLKLKDKNGSGEHLDISLQDALEKSFTFALGSLSVVLELSYPFEEHPSLQLHWHSQTGKREEKLTLALQGQDALLVKSDPSSWLKPSFTVDLVRAQPSLCLIDDEQGNTLFFAFDKHGRVQAESFSSSQLHTLLSYDQGFEGYGVQAIVSIPSFSASREDKERAYAYELTNQLQQALAQQPPLAPPLRFFEQACQKAQVNFAEAFVEFLAEWQASSGFLFRPTHPLSDSLRSVINHLKWDELSKHDQQSSQWTSCLLNQLENSLEEGDEPLTVLERNHWPFLSDFQHALQQNQQTSPLNILAQQVASLITYLPPLHTPTSLSIDEQVHLLSAYFRAYGMDYRSLIPFQGTDKEQWDTLETYWKAHHPEEKELRQSITFETPLTSRIIPTPAPLKLEDHRPGIVLEVQQGQQKQSIALAYDASGVGLRWAILNGQYVLRFQPRLHKLPYRIRLRQARQISYPQSPQVYSYESDLLISENENPPIAQTLSMNHVHETWDGYRFYLAGVGTSGESGLKRIQLAVNHDPAKYFLTYPGAVLVFIGIILLFWIYPSRKKSSSKDTINEKESLKDNE